MTHTIYTRNVNTAFVEGWWWLRTTGRQEQSRAGPVLVAPSPVVTEYSHPEERVLFDPRRDANPVFHLMEAIWVISGSADVRFLEQFNSRYREYADPGVNYVWGAYGRRLRYPHDQILQVVDVLRKDPQSRQAVLSMWVPDKDLGTVHNDRPCNTHIYLDLRDGALNMTVMARSNDMLWGAYGANVVVFSMLQELLASALGVQIGVLRQFSNNFHVYTDLPQVQSFLDTPPHRDDVRAYPRRIPLVGEGENWLDFISDCENLVSDSRAEPTTCFMRDVAVPLYAAYLFRKQKLLGLMNSEIAHAATCDWKIAFLEWVERRTK